MKVSTGSGMVLLGMGDNWLEVWGNRIMLDCKDHYKLIRAIMVKYFVLAIVICISSAFSRKSYPLKKDPDGVKMKEFIVKISNYADSVAQRNMYIIPQNGIELAFDMLDVVQGNIDKDYLRAIDGIGVEDLFFEDDSKRKTNKDKLIGLKYLRAQNPSIPIFVSDYVIDKAGNSQYFDQKIKENNLIAFRRIKNNKHYELIERSINEDDSDVKTMEDVENYLYYINSNYKNKADFVAAVSQTNHDLIIIDLFQLEDDCRAVQLSREDIATLKRKANGGERLVICYMNIGLAETYRYYWEVDWGCHGEERPDWIGEQHEDEDYPDEFWVEYWTRPWQGIIINDENSYLDKIVNSGFDGIYLDNVEAYDQF